GIDLAGAFPCVRDASPPRGAWAPAPGLRECTDNGDGTTTCIEHIRDVVPEPTDNPLPDQRTVAEILASGSTAEEALTIADSRIPRLDGNYASFLGMAEDVDVRAAEIDAAPPRTFSGVSVILKDNIETAESATT